MGHNNSFGEYLMDIYMLIKENKDKGNKMGYSIRRVDFDETDIYPNEKYFKECFEGNETPEHVIENLHYNEDELCRKIKRFKDETIIDEVSRRGLIYSILSNADTDDIECELGNRWDSTLLRVCDLSDEDLIDELIRRNHYKFSCKNDGKLAIICETLGLSNSFAYTEDEVINEIKKLF